MGWWTRQGRWGKQGRNGHVLRRDEGELVKDMEEENRRYWVVDIAGKVNEVRMRRQLRRDEGEDSGDQRNNGL